MKSVMFSTFGGPDVLSLVEREKPVIADNELLIRVHAAGMNPVDYKIREGHHRLSSQLTLPSGLGFDLSGEIAQVGCAVQGWSVGDAVLGVVSSPLRPGSYAAYACVTADTVVRKPAGLSFEVAAALPTAGLTALQALQAAKLSSGQAVLIHAAAGGVGHLAVQLAHHLGARVIATASAANHDFLHRLGADICIDYHEDAWMTPWCGHVDAVIDLVGGDTGIQSLSLLTPTGCLVTVPSNTAEKIIEAGNAQRRGVMGLHKKNNSEQLAHLARLVVASTLHVEIARVFTLDRAAEAHHLLEGGHVRGKCVFAVTGECA